MPAFDPNPDDKMAAALTTARCDGCGRHYSFVKAEPQPDRCQICDLGPGNTARLCTYCHMPFAQVKKDNYQCCSASCGGLLVIDIRDGRRRPEYDPVQPWDEPEPYDGPENGPEIAAGEAICIDCGASFIPNRGPGLPGRGRTRLRCSRCSPSKLDGLQR